MAPQPTTAQLKHDTDRGRKLQHAPVFIG